MQNSKVLGVIIMYPFLFLDFLWLACHRLVVELLLCRKWAYLRFSDRLFRQPCPLGSEPVVFAMVKANPDLFALTILVTMVGNTPRRRRQLCDGLCVRKRPFTKSVPVGGLAGWNVMVQTMFITGCRGLVIRYVS